MSLEFREALPCDETKANIFLHSLALSKTVHLGMVAYLTRCPSNIISCVVEKSASIEESFASISIYAHDRMKISSSVTIKTIDKISQ